MEINAAWGWGMAQMPAQEEEDPEFKPQYHKKLVKKASL
jgi:hypothetical protein